MKKNNLLYLLAVTIVGQLFFSCNTARQYEFSGRSQGYHSEKALAKTESQPEQVVLNQEIAAEETPENLTASATPEIAPTAVQPQVNFQEKALEIKAPEAAPRLNSELTRTDKKELKSALKKLKKQAAAGNQEALQPTINIVELIFAIILPPVGVLLHEGGLNGRFWISLLLTLLFFFPGMIYAILVVTDTI
ncbi:YqaE/Pmp3 family membrane protein [Adhaeribacter terrigena]|uniref:YqaE/Pmp3 family membrane protein n=1 Tax=Adhaeribacter terrigena TaxID=2793070 RepID=UPI001F1AFFB7|nr:YqaE/Pmp3 family membrane protein [Adhaeribacter terrigena]